MLKYACVAFMMASISANALTVDQIVNGAKLVDEVKNLKTKLDTVKNYPTDEDVPLYIGTMNFFYSTGTCNCLPSCCPTTSPKFPDVEIKLPKSVIADLIQQKIDDDMKALTALGVTAP